MVRFTIIYVAVPERLSCMTRNHVAFARAGSNSAVHAFLFILHLPQPGTGAPWVPSITLFYRFTLLAPGLNSSHQSCVPVTAESGRGRSTTRAPDPLSFASSLTCGTTAHASFVTAASCRVPLPPPRQKPDGLTQAHIQS
jgi:hypothetical protein